MSNTYEFHNADGLGDFGNAANWVDETSPAIPGPPGSSDTALVETAGTINGTGDVGTLVLDGTSAVLTSELREITAGALELEGRVALAAGSSYDVSGEVQQVGTSTVTMSGGSEVYAGSADSADTTSFDVAVSSGDQSNFNLTGLGTLVELAAGNAVIGDAGIGAMTIGAGAEFKTDVGGVILCGTAGGQGTLTVNGSFSALTAAGEVQVGQGRLSILAGAEASSLGLNIEGTTGGSASVLVSGAGSRLTAGDTSIGGEPGASSLTIAQGGFAQVGSLQIGAPGVLGANNVLVEGAGSTLEIRGDLVLGEPAIGPGGHYFNDSGSLEITSGAQVLQDSNSRDIVGEEGSSTGSISVSGHGSTLNTGVASLVVGDDGTGTVVIKSGGNILSSALSGPAVTVGNYNAGSVTIDGTGSNWTATGEFDVGYYYGTGTVLVAAGASLETGHSNGVAGFVIGNQAEGSGTATITGTGSTLTNSGEFIIGDAGSGTFKISAGGVVSTSLPSGNGIDGAVIGEASGSSGIVDVTGAGSRWTIGSDLVIGSAGTGSLTIGSGSTVTAARLQMADAGTGSLDVSGASAKLAIGGNAQFGNGGSAAVTIARSGQVSISGNAELKNGQMMLAGGELDVAKTLTLDAGQLLSGYGTVQASSIINSATVQASAGTLSFIGGVTGSGKLEIEAASTLSLGGRVGSGQETIFEAAAGKLVLTNPTSFAGTIDNFSKGNKIDLSAVVAGSLTYRGQTLTVHESGGAALSLKFSGTYTQCSFGMTSDGHGGTFITHT
jgi:fibronectin-binding autotransporter adhesin